ncbi:MAG: hypothetical protein ACXWKQ_07360 [Reyranella sp.]
MGAEQRAAIIAFRGIVAAVANSGLEPERQKTAAVYLLVTGGNLQGAAAARILGCTKQNVSKLLRQVENRRDDPPFDAVLSRLEAQLFGEV